MIDDRGFHLLPGGPDARPEVAGIHPCIVQQHDQDGEEYEDKDSPQSNSVSQADGHGDQKLG